MTTTELDGPRVAEIGKYRILTEQHQVATHGFDASVCRREDSMCNLVLHGGVPVVVPDASKDDRFRDNPFVTGVIGDVRFYATYQLSTPEGVVIGSLCVFDLEPRLISADQERALAALAERVVDLLELELRTRELSTSLQDLQDAQAELERSNEQLAAFAGQVSHDLRNPLTAVTLSLKMIGEDVGADSTEIEFLVTRAIGGAERMQSLIDDLLAFARVGGELPTVIGDPVQLRAVLQNLVANAAKFTRPGEPAHIEVDGTRMGASWRVEVCDRGPGIPADQQERVFQPLARVNDDVEGSGIGLTTCRRIVEAHGGRIGLTDTAYGGTCAWFELPV